MYTIDGLDQQHNRFLFVLCVLEICDVAHCYWFEGNGMDCHGGLGGIVSSGSILN